MTAVSLILNPAAGGGRAVRSLEPVVGQLRARGARVRILVSPHVRAVDELVAGCVAAGERCVSVGGDGMLSSMATAVHRHGAWWGIVPAGRGNDFARQLGVPSDPARLADALLARSPTYIDAIRVGGALVVGSVYAGVDSNTSQIVNGLRGMPSALQYPYGAVRALATFPRTAYTVTVDATVHRYDGFTVVAANSGYYGKGMHIAPLASVTDGLLDVVMVAAGSRARFIAQLPSLYRGTHVERPEVTVVRGRSVHIEAADVAAYADGEPLAELPVTATVVPGALAMLLG